MKHVSLIKMGRSSYCIALVVKFQSFPPGQAWVLSLAFHSSFSSFSLVSWWIQTAGDDPSEAFLQLQSTDRVRHLPLRHLLLEYLISC